MKNEYKITKKRMMSWAKELPLYHAPAIVLFVLWCLLALMNLGLLALLIANGGTWLTWYLSIFLLIVSLYKLFLSRFVYMSSRYKLLSKTYGVSEWTRTTEFAEDEIIISDHTTVQRFQYGNITKIYEKNNDVIIFFNQYLSIRILKDAFVEGTWEECRDKINSKRT